MDLSLIEVLNFAYAQLVENADEDQRKKIDDTLAGKIGSGGGYIIDDPLLPSDMQGKEAPAWWDPYHDPWKNAQSIPEVEGN